MKKFLKFFAIAICMLFAGVALTACGGKAVPLTEENVVGVWRVEKVAYDAAPEDEVELAQDSYQKKDITWDWNKYWKVDAKYNAGTELTEDETYGYTEIFYTLFNYYEFTALDEEGVGEVWATGFIHRVGTWGLKDGAIEYTDEAWGEPDALTFTADWQKNGNVVINVDCPDRVGGFYVGTLKFTLKKYNNIELATPLNIDGVWEITSLTRTPEGGESVTHTKAEYLANEELGEQEDDNYSAILHNEFTDLTLFLKIEYVQNVAYSHNPENDEAWTPNWAQLTAYENNKLVFAKRLGTWEDCSAEYKNGKLTLTATWGVENEVETFVWTLEKYVPEVVE